MTIEERVHVYHELIDGHLTKARYQQILAEDARHANIQEPLRSVVNSICPGEDEMEARRRHA